MNSANSDSDNSLWVQLSRFADDVGRADELSERAQELRRIALKVQSLEMGLPKIERIPLDPDVVALLHKILDINGLIVDVLCHAPIIGPPLHNSRSEHVR